jgi:hypothetical protein
MWKISAFWWFKNGLKKKNMPAGATPRYVMAVPLKKLCLQCFRNIYTISWTQRTHVFDLPAIRVNKQGDAILDRLKTTNYGRCDILSNG